MNDKPFVVLAVDDEPSNIDLLRAILPKEIKVKVAINGEKALQIAGRPPYPDLVFLDVMMPGMDGYEVCRCLKADPATRGIPVVFLSGHTGDAERAQGLALGARDFITKPIEPESVLRVVRQVVEAGTSCAP